MHKFSMQSRKNLILISILGSAVIPVAISYYINNSMPIWIWQDQIIHTLIEGYGCTAAVIISALIIILFKFKQLNSEHLWPASALLGMGILDGFHAACNAGNLFVWLHSMATFVGGTLFALIWIPRKFTDKQFGEYLPVITLFVVITFGLWSIFNQSAIPVMAQDGQFTSLAKILNITGAIGFIVATAFYSFKLKDEYWLMFTNHCLLFGVAGLLFESSALWDTNWWLWHYLRALAYTVGIYYFLRMFYDNQMSLQTTNKALETRVEEKTKALIKSNKKLVQKKLELEQSNRDLEQLAYVASHDLKAPLRTIIGFTDLLQDNLDSNGSDQENQIFMSEIINGTNRMQKLIDDLLSYSKISGEQIPKEEIELHLLLKEIEDDLKNTIESEAVEITYSDEMPALEVNPTLIRQLFQNLLLNAIKFRGDLPPKIEITHQRKDGFNIVSVKDNGIGIDPKYHKQIFDLFRRLHSMEDYEGTGIGLALVKRITELHSGKIEVESILGKGTTFAIHLPYTDPGMTSSSEMKKDMAIN